MRNPSPSLTAGPSVSALMAELSGSAGQADPYPIYARLRALGPALPGPDDSLIVTGYRECSALLREPRLRKHPGRLLVASGYPDWERHPSLEMMFTSLLMLNPPEHTRLRGRVARAFTARRVAQLRPAVETIADRLLDALPARFDFVDAIAFPLPVTVIGELLGVPVADRPRFRKLVAEWSAVLEILSPIAVRRADRAATEIAAYFTELAQRRRREPEDDVISALVAPHRDGEPPLAADELVKLVALILAAGFETTTGLLANGLVALLEHPAQADRLRAAPELARAAVQELLRFDSPVQMIYGRTAMETLRVAGVELHAGQRVITVLGAANRDPVVFTEPDRLILDRDEGVPLSFGAGVHHCLGAALARLEAEVLFERLLARAPDLALGGRPERRPGLSIHGYSRLPVTTA